MTVRIQRPLPGVQPQGVASYQGLRTEEPSKQAIAMVPVVDEQLVEHLRAVFPATLSRDFSLRDYDTMLGHREVIDYLARVLKEQSDN